MPVTMDDQLKEHIPYDSTRFPISFFHDELADLPQWNGPLHWHSGFEIATAENETLDYQVGEKHVTLNAGDSIFINGNLLHGIRQISGHTADPLPNIVFSGSLIAPEGSQIYQKYILPVQQCDDLPFVVFPKENKNLQTIQNLIQQIYHCFRTQPPCYELMIQRAASSIFEYIFLKIDTFPRYPSNRIQLINQIRMQKMLDFIHHHYSGHISLNDLARAANVSRSEVGRCFKAFMNRSPIEILIRHRLQIAHKMLAEGIYTVEEISNACGFSSVNYFRRQFKSKYGIPPSAFPESCRRRNGADSVQV